MHSNPHRIPIEEMAKYFVVDPNSPTGLRRTQTTSSNAIVNSPAGSLSPSTGYYQTTFQGKRYANSRIVYALHHKMDPGAMLVDHIDGDRRNNSIENLRLVTNRQNTAHRRNQGKCPPGVTHRPDKSKRNPFVAKIKVDRKFKHLGYHPTAEAAYAAYLAACRELEGGND